jgi:membrane associated rhomboid family serine protease
MLKRLSPVIALIGVCWLVFCVNLVLWHGRLNQYGIVPRHFASVAGILWAPFLHASLRHLTANTFPLLILGGILCGRSRVEFVEVAIVGIVAGGGLTWLLARPGCVIGASGLVFCFFGYLASLAFFRRTVGAFLISLVCIVLFWGMLRGIVPTSSAVSWEGHAAGLVSGVGFGWVGSKSNRGKKEAA